MIGLNVLNTFFKCTKLKTPFGQRLKYAKTAQPFRIRTIINYSIPGLNFRFGVFHCALSLALISFVCLFYTVSFAIDIYEPGFNDSLFVELNTPTGANYGNIFSCDNGDIYVTGGRAFEVFRISDGKQSSIGRSKDIAIGVYVDNQTLLFGDAGGSDGVASLYLIDLITEVTEPPIDVSEFGTVQDIVKAPDTWGSFGGQFIIAGVGSGTKPSAVYAFNRSNNKITPIVTTAIAEASFTNLAFTNNNELIATTYSGRSLVLIGPDGTITKLADFDDVTEAVDVHRFSGHAFVVTNNEHGEGKMYRVNLTTRNVSLFADSFTVNLRTFPHPLAFSKDGRVLYYGEQIAGEYVVRQISGFETPIINDLVTFDPDPSTYSFSTNTKGCPSGFIGKFNFDARLTNISEKELSNLIVEVDELTNNNLLLTDEGLISESGFIEINQYKNVIIPYLDTEYKFKVVSFDSEHGFEQPEFDDSMFSIGDAGFGTLDGYCSLNNSEDVNTTWRLHTDILLRKWFSLKPEDKNVEVAVAVDNDVQIFVNGIDISDGLQIHEGCPERDSFVFNVPNGILDVGDNLIAVRGRDRGTLSYLDIQMTKSANDYSDGILSPGESIDVPSTVCLNNTKPFRFYVNVLGIKSSLNEGLVAYFPYNGNADDESGNGNHGVVYGAILTEDRFGNTNSAYNFDGMDDYVEVYRPLSLSELTFSVWLKIPDVYINNNRIVTINGVGEHYYALQGNSSNALSLVVDGEEVNEYDWSFSHDAWTHVVMTYDGHVLKLYKNGVLTESGVIESDSITGPLYIGGVRAPDYSAQNWDGEIDDVRIYERVLSSADINALYNLGN